MLRHVCAAAVAAVALLAGPAFAQPGDPEGVLVEELVVNAALPGPAWWRVSDADSTVYVLAIPALTPKDIAFDSSVLERRLEGANRLILPPQVEVHPIRLVGLLVGVRKRFLSEGPMSQSLAPELQARYRARLSALGKKPTEYDDVKPAFAGFLLANTENGNVHIDLGEKGSIVGKTLKIAETRRAKPRIRRVDGYDLPRWLGGVGALPHADQERCLAAGITQSELGLGGIRTNAERWAAGDSQALAAASRGFSACFAASPAIAREMRQGMASSAREIEAALKLPGQSVALVEFRPLLAEGGVLEQLKARGYQVATPGE